jgi:hypothetical protein
MLKSPDALRSERHAITKYAIDKGLYGDSDSGTRISTYLDTQLILETSSKSEPEELEADSNKESTL